MTVSTVRDGSFTSTMPTTQKIRYSDCDPQGIVFNGNYARYWDDALTDWFEEAGFGGTDLGGIGADVVAARLEIDFKASAVLGDMLETSLEVERIGNTSMTVGFETRRGDGTVVVEGRETLVFVDPDEFRPVEVPGEIRDVFGGESV
jgi:YbgC/YbaW family acyl-CoA thioester hydrolase